MKQQDKELKETPQNGERKVFFLCNGNKAGCTKEACFKNGGGCRHTSDVGNAANFREGIGEGLYYEKTRSNGESPSMQGDGCIDGLTLNDLP